jgi:hypothetical protein
MGGLLCDQQQYSLQLSVKAHLFSRLQQRQLTLMLPVAVAAQSNMPYELDATSLNTFGECDMNGQLETPVLAAHYRVVPGRQQLQHNNSNGNGTAYAEGDIQPMQQYPDGRTMVGFSFNTKMPTGAEMIFYEFAGRDGFVLHVMCLWALAY